MAASIERDQEVVETPLNNQFDLTYVRRSFDRSNPQSAIAPYVSKGQVVADLGCGPGFYTLALAAAVGPEGKVYAVDFDEQCIRALEDKVEQGGYHNVETHATSASNLPFIPDASVDFVLANGLLCSMTDHRQDAVSEIKRILKPSGQAYLSLGAPWFPPLLGYVNRAEWERTLDGFQVARRGGSLQKWAVVSLKPVST
jgi:ubiquinone/menaquinone biosynthesis C-methylase UbiE